jgi:hypothetical protein
MSAYNWYVKGIWFGIEGPKYDAPMLGIIKRSGMCRASGHFCHVKIPVNGKKVWASGAEDRTFYMHLVEWGDLYGKIPKDMIPALGWNKDDIYCFYKDGQVWSAGSGGTLQVVHPDLWQDDWFKIPHPLDPHGTRPLTLIEKGVQYTCSGDINMYNWYIALIDASGEPRVTLPANPKWGVTVDKHGRILGVTGAAEIWNGDPKPWCKEIVEVKSKSAWRHVKDDEKTIIWKRES